MDYQKSINSTKSYLTNWERDLHNLKFNQPHQTKIINNWLKEYNQKGSINRINRILDDKEDYELRMTKTLKRSRNEYKREICILNLELNLIQQQYYTTLKQLINN